MESIYTTFSVFYDITTFFYFSKRKKVISSLNLKKKDNVLVIACGTGQSFSEIEKYLKGTGLIVAFDFSEDMLDIAQKRIDKNNWKNIKLLKLDSNNMTSELFIEKFNIDKFDVIIAELALSVIPNWKEVISRSANMLKKGGKLAVLDWQIDSRNILSKTIDFLANSKCNRKIKEEIKRVFPNTKILKYYFGRNIFISISRK